MARSKTFLRTRDIDWAVELGGRYIHVSSAGGDLPAIVEDRLFEIWRELKDADIVCEEEDVELNEKYLSEKFPVEAEGNNVVRNISREWYIHSFKAMAMRGFYSFDRDVRFPIDESKYRMVAKPGKLKRNPEFNLPKIDLNMTPEELDGVDIVKLIDERNNQ